MISELKRLFVGPRLPPNSLCTNDLANALP